MIESKHYKVIGTMSGTSLDGLDIAFCEFQLKNEKWEFSLKNYQTISYSSNWQERLSNLENTSALEFVKTDVELGAFFGKKIQSFIQENELEVDFIASHGHTIFHQPEIRLTSQIGSGAEIAAICQKPVINNFRIADVALGGQAAPLVPIGDKLLFSDYDYCLNLGGFANITQQSETMLAFDICACNLVLNHLSQKLGFPYDKNGILGRKGIFDKTLFEELNELPFFKKNPPKSLGKEWVLKEVYPIIENSKLNTESILTTFYHHIAFQIHQVIEKSKSQTDNKKLLITGGGAFNSFLIEKIKQYQHSKSLEIIIPTKEIIDFKEALIFAFLGVLRWEKTSNCLKSVTGATKNAIGGVIHY